MGQAEVQTRRYTPEEYFTLEETSAVRHEYFEGEVSAMAGASKRHNKLALNMAFSLSAALQNKGCEVFLGEVRLAVQEGKFYTYPDVVVSCDPTDHQDDYLLKHPVLIVEVLSPSTADYDRAEKFKHYKQLPSLRHYLLVSQVAWIVDWFRRDEAGQWIHTLLTDPTDVLEIPDLGLQLPLATLYAKAGVAPLRIMPGPDPVI